MKDVEAQLIHDMQNTAMVIQEAASQLDQNRDTLPPGVVAHLCEMLTRRSDMLVRLLADLSTSHLAQRGELDLSLQRVSLPDICGEVLAERQPVAGGQITVDVADDAVLVGDPMRVTQVLDNLVTNALRYGGPNVKVSAARDGAHVRLTVRDDGPGVPESLLDTLYHAYARGPESHGVGGSGLGMLIVRQLCEAMGGRIDYDGSSGARFTATFPALPMTSRALGPDLAARGHSVALWSGEENLVGSTVSYIAHGLAAGEAVLVAATPAHHRSLDIALAALGIDVEVASESGQYLRFDADVLHNDLPRLQHIDRERFEALIGATVEQLSSRWCSIRVFGEIVDLYWRRGDNHLALELEACWNALRARISFPLLCGYELAPGEGDEAIHDFHDMVIPA